MNELGRRKLMMATDFIGLVVMMCFLMPNFWLAVFLRFVSGIIVGINSSVIPLYLKEMSPVSISGLVGSLNNLFINLGMIVAYVLGLFFPISP